MGTMLDLWHGYTGIMGHSFLQRLCPFLSCMSYPPTITHTHRHKSPQCTLLVEVCAFLFSSMNVLRQFKMNHLVCFFSYLQPGRHLPPAPLRGSVSLSPSISLSFFNLTSHTASCLPCSRFFSLMNTDIAEIVGSPW